MNKQPWEERIPGSDSIADVVRSPSLALRAACQSAVTPSLSAEDYLSTSQLINRFNSSVY